MELDDTERPQGTRPLRRFHTRIVVAAVAAAVAATVAAGLAFAETRPAPIGNGIVVIDTDLAYQNGQAAGTGMVLTSSGVVLTNNHVIRNATTIKVVVPSTGRSYSASVVGYDATDDVAVLQANDASNLKTVSLGNSADVRDGQSVTAVGNAGGTGSLTHASGKVTDVNRAITVSDDQGGSENLSGLIETNASVQPGDSGGPLLNAAGQVIGMDTAASTSQGYGFDQTTTSDGLRDSDQQGAADRAADREWQRVEHDPHRRHSIPRRRGDAERLRQLRRSHLVGGVRRPRGLRRSRSR